MSSVAVAQSTDSEEQGASESSSTSTEHPDIVETADGSVIRGVILEKIVGDQVSIETATGRQFIFQWEQVVYAGPADQYEPSETSGATGNPSQAAPEQSQDEASASNEEKKNVVKFVVPEGEEELAVRQYIAGGTVRAGTAVAVVEAYSDDCDTPCAFEVENDPEGSRWHVTYANKNTRGATLTLDDYVSGDVSVDFKSRKSTRIALGISGAITAAAGIALVAVDLLGDDNSEDSFSFDGEEESDPLFSPVGITGLVLTPIGAALMTSAFYIPDSADAQYLGNDRDLPEDFAFPDIDEIRERAGNLRAASENSHQ
jgi:hypothetical protein